MQETTVTLVQQPQGEVGIIKNGVPLMCPFQNAIAIPVQQKFGGEARIEFVRFNCDSKCPHFLIDENLQEVVLNCVSSKTKYKIDTPKKEGLKIVSSN